MLQTYIVMLRGINVSGHRPMRMAEFRIQLADMGFIDISTYIQSGNIVFRAENVTNENMSGIIAQMILEKYDYNIPVITRKYDEWKMIIDKNPFIGKTGVDTKYLHVTFLSESPSSSLIPSLDSVDHNADRYEVIEDRIYLYCPNGYGRTKLSNNFIESKLNVSATSRNWKTVCKLDEMAAVLS